MSDNEQTPLSFTTKPSVPVPVTIDGRDYVLEAQAREAAAVRWRNAVLGATYWKDGPDGKRVMVNGDTALAQPALVAECLYEVVKGIKTKVPLDFVLGLDPEVVSILFQRVMAVSKLKLVPDRDEEAELAKN